MGKGSIANRSYLRRVAGAAATKANTLYTFSKCYTPASIVKIEERAERSLKDLLDDKHLIERGDSVITNLDERLDLVVDQVEGIMTESHAKAERVGEMISPIVNSVAFVTSNVGKSFIRTNEEQTTEADRALCEKFTQAIASASDTYARCLVCADQHIEVWLPSESEESPEEVASVSKITAKAARKLKSAAFTKLDMAKLRTQTQLNELVTVDLIQYASESMDGVANAVVQAKHQVEDTQTQLKTKFSDKVAQIESSVSDTKQLMISKFDHAKTKAEARQAQAQDMVDAQKAIAVQRLQTVYAFVQGKWTLVTLTSQYSAVTAAVNNALTRCEGLRDCAIASVAFTKTKTAVLFTDGAVALVDNLRVDRLLPEKGVVTLRNFLARSKHLASDLLELCRTSPALALAKVQELYAALLEAARDAPALIQAQIKELLELSKQQTELYQQMVLESAGNASGLAHEKAQMVRNKAEQLLELARASPDTARELLTQLFAQLEQIRAPKVRAAYTAVEAKVTAQVEDMQSKVECKISTATAQVVTQVNGVRSYGLALAEQSFDIVAPHVVNAIKAAPYGGAAFDKLGSTLKASAVWSYLPAKVTSMLLSTEAVVEAEDLVESESVAEESPEEHNSEDDDMLFCSPKHSKATEEPSDPLSTMSRQSEAVQEALYTAGENLFELCDKKKVESVTKSEIKALRKAEKKFEELFCDKGWGEWWKLIEADQDGSYNKDSFASAYAQLAYNIA